MASPAEHLGLFISFPISYTGCNCVLVQRELDFWFVYDKQSQTEESLCERNVTIILQKKK
jgi:hypothetical protein